jgi:integrase/recombinase XerD
VHVRRPRLDYESHATGLDRNDVGAMLVAAGLASAGDHALISLLALNGLRVSEAIGANVEALGLERGHRTLTITRKGGKVVTVPLAPRTARAIDLAVAERCEGPIFVGVGGERLDRHAAARIVRRIARRAGINKRVGPHTLRHAFITAALDAGVRHRELGSGAPQLLVDRAWPDNCLTPTRLSFERSAGPSPAPFRSATRGLIRACPHPSGSSLVCPHRRTDP